MKQTTLVEDEKLKNNQFISHDHELLYCMFIGIMNSKKYLEIEENEFEEHQFRFIHLIRDEYNFMYEDRVVAGPRVEGELVRVIANNGEISLTIKNVDIESYPRTGEVIDFNVEAN